VELARAQRAFLGRTVRYLVGMGVRQFLDIGTGLPTENNTHEVAQRAAPEARVTSAPHPIPEPAPGAVLRGPAATSNVSDRIHVEAAWNQLH
jgi:hypothetical protein